MNLIKFILDLDNTINDVKSYILQQHEIGKDIKIRLPKKSYPIHPYIINEELKLKMLETTIKGVEKQIELGFNLHKNKLTNQLITRGDFVGIRGQLERTKTFIDKYEFEVGGFHTHQRYDFQDAETDATLPSWGDLRNINYDGLGCIGGIDHEKYSVKCYEKKDGYDPFLDYKLKEIMKNSELFFDDTETEEEYDENIIQGPILRNNILKEHFNVIKIV